MKKIILIGSFFSIFFGIKFFDINKSYAGLYDPWYACYVVQGGSLQKCMGPYQNKYACMGAKYSIPYGARWIGCKQ
ncbi:hypothetical protein N9J95_01245 [Candidatus Pelagibacter sp.]|nr:hypothetical protein [Candidatus Pelagibacter sp.]